jgi:hypothetical protein
MHAAKSDVQERWDHLGIRAWVCQQLALARWREEHDASTRHVVHGGTAATALLLHG